MPDVLVTRDNKNHIIFDEQDIYETINEYCGYEFAKYVEEEINKKENNGKVSIEDLLQTGYEESDILVAIEEHGHADDLLKEIEPFLTKKMFKEKGEEIKEIFNQYIYDYIADTIFKALKAGINRTLDSVDIKI